MHSKVNQLYKYMYPLFLKFFSHIGHYRVLGRVPCVIQWVLISYLLIYSSVYMSIPISQLIPPCYPLPIFIIKEFAKDECSPRSWVTLKTWTSPISDREGAVRNCGWGDCLVGRGRSGRGSGWRGGHAWPPSDQPQVTRATHYSSQKGPTFSLGQVSLNFESSFPS